MAIFSIKHFRCDIIWGAANGFSFFSFELELCGKAEIAEFDFHFIAEEEIAKF
jgi:hypothetical protein